VKAESDSLRFSSTQILVARNKARRTKFDMNPGDTPYVRRIVSTPSAFIELCLNGDWHYDSVVD
jgi:hypothetical protein